MAHTTGRQGALRRRLLPGIAVAALAAGTVSLVPGTAEAWNSVPTSGGDTWGVHDAANPGIDTGSVRNTAGNALQGYGGIRVDVEGGTSRLNGILLRGFGLTYDGRETFTTTTGVNVDGIVVRRELVVPKGESYGRFFDTFTNSTKKPITLQVAFGGQLGYDTGENQSELSTTGNGDETIDAADGWASWHTPTTAAGNPSQNGPSATVFGTPGREEALDRVGNFLLDPFTKDLPATGDAANHPGFVTTLTVEPGDTVSLLHYVVTGLPEGRAVLGATRPAGSEVTRVEQLADSLAALPATDGLSTAELCSVVNFDSGALGLAGAECDQATMKELVNLAKGSTLPKAPATTSSYDVVGKTITQLVADMRTGKTSSQQIVRAYLDRIAAYDRGPAGLNSVITVAPDAMKQARAADEARKKGDKRPFLGIPVLAKDIIDTKDMPTTGGSSAFDGYQPKTDAFQVDLMRKAGAIILGKANLAEFANDGHFSPNGFGAVWNAFDPSRSPIGSSGGTAVALASGFAAAAWGTQTGDSLWGPAGAASLYSLRGTDGMQSSGGTMPLTFIQDYVGWISQSLEDLALLLDVTAVDNPADPIDDVANGHRPTDWSSYLTADALEGKVIGVPELALVDPFGTTEVTDALKAKLAVFEQAGATVKVIPEFDDVPTEWKTADFGNRGYEGWLQWLAEHPDAPYTKPEEITGNDKRVPYQVGSTAPATGMTAQEIKNFQDYRAKYRDNVATWMDDNGVDAVLYATELSEIHLNDSIQPSFGRKDPQSSAAGVPTVIFPAGTTENGNPVGFQLQGKEFQDAELLGFAYAFDKIAKGRVLPLDVTPRLAYDADALPDPIEDLEPGKPGKPTPATKRLTVLSKKAPVKVRNGRATISLSVGCASASAGCTGTVKVKVRGKTYTKKVTVRAGGQAVVRIKLSKFASAKLRKGKKQAVKVTFTGKAGTKSSTKAVKVVAKR
ncbi:amidase [Nocardioides sp. zg-536]|uniref:Amidase n=1 Tax=Nocardioides faecalis TaxID=2803858 RepID=A0A938Y2C4_9ACTN|nr:amidase [Nocardioides faecalis]MBM9458673.1 amidase [Nocardioides faecalis]QVI58666.1 amidase [Nocardioides faecalis]